MHISLLIFYCTSIVRLRVSFGEICSRVFSGGPVASSALTPGPAPAPDPPETCIPFFSLPLYLLLSGESLRVTSRFGLELGGGGGGMGGEGCWSLLLLNSCPLEL